MRSSLRSFEFVLTLAALSGCGEPSPSSQGDGDASASGADPQAGGASGSDHADAHAGSPGSGDASGSAGGESSLDAATGAPDGSDGATSGGGTAGQTSGDASSGSTAGPADAGADSGGDGGSTEGGAGMSGNGALPSVPDNGCNVRLSDTPIGFASQNGSTTGGGTAMPILVTTPADLKKYLADAQPRVLYVMKDLDFRTENRAGVQTCEENTACDNGGGGQTRDPRVSASCDANEHASTSYRNDVSLSIASNKTVIGIGEGSGAAIRGASLNIGSSQQVILRNLKVFDVNRHLVEAGDGITLQGSKFIWLDHLVIAQISDGFVDIGSAKGATFDDNITLSWIHFDGRAPSQCGGKHHYVNFVDNGRVTYHHNFYDNCSGRNPKLGGAPTRVHLFNNYWRNVSYFCLTAQHDAQARVESNYYEDSLRPHWLQLDGDGKAAIAIDDGNVYAGTSSGSTNRDTGGTAFSVPYAYTKESAAAAKAAVVKCSGPQPIR